MEPTERGVGSGLHAPVLGGGTVERERLVAAVVDGGVQQVVLCAPAGAGKTTVLAQLANRLRARGEVVCWLTLEQGDAGPRHLLTRLLATLTDGLAAAGSASAEEVGRLVVPSDPVDDGMLSALADLLAASGRTVWLVVDDAHVLPPGRSVDGLDRLLDLADPGLRAVVACRWDAALPLARRVVERRAVELRAEALAFDKREAAALLAGHGVVLDDSDLAELLTRTEGWAAGLRLAALSLAQAPDVRAFIDSFTGDRRPVADYLVTEVLRGLRPEVRELMLATSAPAQLTVDLAASLTRRPDAGAVLDELARANVLTTRTETDPPVFRYHSLLRTYLSAEAAARDRTAFLTGHVRASEHYASTGSVSLALEHAALGQAWSRASALLRSHGLPLLLRGEGGVVRATLERMPQEAREAPEAVLLDAHLSLLDGSATVAEALLDRLDARRPRDGGDVPDAAVRTALRLYAARLSGRRDAATRALLDEPRLEDSSPEALFLSAMRGMLRLDLQDFDASEHELERARAMAHELGYDLLALDCMSHLVLSAAGSGRARDMVDRAEEATEFAAQRGWERLQVMRPTYALAAWGAWSVMDEAGTERNLRLVESLTARSEPRLTAFTRLLQAYAELGGTGAYAALARRARDIWDATDESALGAAAASALLPVELAYGERAGDASWVRETLARAERTLAGTGDLLVLRAWHRLLDGDVRAAQDVVRPVLDGRLPTHPRITCYAWLVECRCAVAQGRREHAHEALLAALDVAGPRSLVRVVAEVPDEVADLLVAGRGRFGSHEGFVRRALQARARAEDGARPSRAPRLTEREAAMLRDLPSLLSLNDIAAAHQVTENTVKSHVRSIYHKLGAHSRREAVSRALELGLL